VDNNSQAKAYAVACDVEYCTLEYDIRNTLPALIQLSGPTPSGPVGLIWLDKFPDHGRDLLTNPDYAPLVSLFSDPKLLKVGVSLTSDTINLAKWCGIDEKSDADFFFSGIVNIEREIDFEIGSEKSLKALAQSVLQRNLPKIKGKRRSEKDRIHRKPTAHWRTNNLTDAMKMYAVNDVSCAIDIWLKMNGLVASKTSERSVTKSVNGK
jgi:hypothetical protein